MEAERVYYSWFYEESSFPSHIIDFCKFEDSTVTLLFSEGLLSPQRAVQEKYWEVQEKS